MPLLFNMLSRFFIAFLQRSKGFLILCLKSPSAVILEPKKIKSVTFSTVSPSICHEVMGLNAMILVFWMLSFKPAFSLCSLTLIKRLFSSSSFSATRVVSPVYLRLLIFLLAVLIPACDLSSLAFYVMQSTYKLYKQGDMAALSYSFSFFFGHIPFPVLNHSGVPCKVLTVASWPAYRFHRKQEGSLVFPSL